MIYTKSEGIGGRLRQRIEDFQVEEIPIILEPGEEYTIFWMEKFNWDNNKALMYIAKKLHIGLNRLSVAGTKDKRAVTKQRVSVWNIPPEEIEKINIKDIKLYGFEKSKERLRLGDLKGNSFKIIVRDIGLEKENLKDRIHSAFNELNQGIPNIFGPQRFGEVRPITHLVGKEMLNSKFEEALKIYLSMIFEKEPEDSRIARTVLIKDWNKEGFKRALELFPKRLIYERRMLDYLIKNPNDFAGAIRRLPSKLMKMFINAYQSAVWNKTAEQVFQKGIDVRRIKMVGFDSKLDETNPVDKIILDILKKDKIKFENFKMKSMPELKCSGAEREYILKPENLKLSDISHDDFNQGKLKALIEFSLPSGSYASVILKEIMKN